MKTALITTAILAASSVSAFADIIEVEMLNKNEAGDRMVFSEEVIRAEIGDIIRFVPTDKSHNAQSVKGALPEGQEAFRGKMNNAVEYEITQAGLTAVVCLPHQTMGMVALVVAGNDFGNVDEILEARIPGKGGDKIEALVEEAQSATPAPEDSSEQNS